MQLQNFTLYSDYAIESEARFFDLHNDFEFSHLLHDAKVGVVSLLWKCAGPLFEEKSSTVILAFEGVRSFSYLAVDPDVSPQENLCVYCLGFVPEDIPDAIETTGFTTPKSATDYLVIQFMGGAKIRINANKARCKLEENV